MLQLGATCVQFGQTSYTYVLMDVEDNQQGEDSKSESKLKEYNLNKLNGLERKLNLTYSFDYVHFNPVILSMVALDIATPPPKS